MLKQLVPLLLLAIPALSYWQCGQTPTVTNAPVPPQTAVANVQRITHEEASDTLRVDSTAALQPLKYNKLTPAAAKAVLTQYNLAGLVMSEAPDNGFYGDNHYRIEFIITDMAPMPGNPLLYTVKGKNRYKKTISAFEGLLEIKSLAEFTDPNLRSSVEYMEEDEAYHVDKNYSVQGKFNFKEDSSMASSGQFAGDFSMEFSTPEAKAGQETAGEPNLWFYSDNSPSEGSGYRFVGNWTGFKNPNAKKPVLWARDLFRFANNILDNFYYGERDVTINPKYRALGWDNFWEGEEWWNDSPKEKEKEAK